MNGSTEGAGQMRSCKYRAMYLRNGPVSTDLSHAAGANLMGADLYKNLTNYFINHLTEVRAVC